MGESQLLAIFHHRLHRPIFMASRFLIRRPAAYKMIFLFVPPSLIAKKNLLLFTSELLRLVWELNFFKGFLFSQEKMN
jgi:hypothetical protein